MNKLKLKYLNTSSQKDYIDDENRFLSQRRLSVEKYDNGIVLPLHFLNDISKLTGRVLDANQNYIKLSAWIGGGGERMDAPYLFDELKKSDEKVIYCGVYKHHWGHFLLESTIRLWYYFSLTPKEQEEYKLVFLCRSIEPVAQELEFFELLGIKDKCIWLKEPTQFKTVIVPEGSLIFGESYTKEFLIPFNLISEKIEPSDKKKVYFTRTSYAQNDNTIGECQLENLFKANGYEIISPEKLTLKEQIAIFKGAESLVMLNGSACHTSVFVSNKSNMVILNRFSRKNQAQFIINSAANLTPTYIDCYLTFLPVTHGHGPFLMGITKNLISFCRDNNLNVPLVNDKNDLNYIYEFLRLWQDIYTVSQNFNWINRSFYLEKLPIDIRDFCINKNIIHEVVAFDAEYYAKVYNIQSNQEEHYNNIGWKLGYNPCVDFDTNAYLEKYPDVKNANVNPFEHYIKCGKKEGRKIFPVGRDPNK